MSDYPPCAECARPMRPYSALIADHPGTVAKNSFGLCSGCAQGARERRRGAMPCVVCGLTMRPVGVSEDDAPGTQAHGRHGRCSPCLNKQRRRVYVTVNQPAPVEVPQIDGGPGWRWQMACTTDDDEIMFPPGDRGPWTEARAICATCPVRERNCRPDILAREGTTKVGSRYGMVAGMSPQERSAVVRAERAAVSA